MLEKEFQYYLKNQDELVKQYNGKVIVIVNKEVVGSYSNTKTAYLESVKTLKPGTFLIIHCTPGDESYTIHQRSRTVASA